MQTSRSPSRGALLTLDRGIRVLEEIARADGLGTAKSIGVAVDIKPGTIYQILRTLQTSGYVHRLPGGRYQLGSRIAFLIDHYEAQSATPQVIVDQLQELHRLTDETVYASIASASAVTIVASYEGTRRLRVGKSTIGYSAYPHARASSKAFLAFSDPNTIDDYFDDHYLEALTENTITDWDTLIDRFEEIRQQGFALDREESEVGISCVATPIIGIDGQPIGAYAAALPAARFKENVHSIQAALTTASQTTSIALGYSGPYPPA